MRILHWFLCRFGHHEERMRPDGHLYCRWCDWQDPWDDPLARMIDQMREP